MLRLKDKVALITGAAKGMGETDAVLFAEEGASLILTDVDKENLDKVAEKLKATGTQVLALAVDVASEEDWKKVANEADKMFGRVDILVNNAGILRMEGVEAATKEQWDKIIAVNQTGTWLGIKYIVPLIRKAGGGSIVNLSSVYGLIGTGTSVAYQASKGAIRVISKTAAMEFAKDNIRVNTIFPGMIETSMIETGIETGQSGEEANTMTEQFLKLIPMGRMGDPKEIANAVLYFASEESSYTTGAELVIDGGWTIP